MFRSIHPYAIYIACRAYKASFRRTDSVETRTSSNHYRRNNKHDQMGRILKPEPRVQLLYRQDGRHEEWTRQPIETQHSEQHCSRHTWRPNTNWQGAEVKNTVITVLAMTLSYKHGFQGAVLRIPLIIGRNVMGWVQNEIAVEENIDDKEWDRRCGWGAKVMRWRVITTSFSNLFPLLQDTSKRICWLTELRSIAH